MGTPGYWFFRFKGSASSSEFTGTAEGCSNDAPGVISEPSGGCQDGNVYHVVATARGNARYSTGLAFSTCGSGALSILEATFTANSSVSIVCGGAAYDCINGACLLSTQYDTPGFYESLEECETNCGVGCGGQCVPTSEWETIKKLSNDLKNRSCS